MGMGLSSRNNFSLSNLLEAGILINGAQNELNNYRVQLQQIVHLA